jgi:site-specific recombinase XerD
MAQKPQVQSMLGRGRPPQRPTIIGIRELTDEDLLTLQNRGASNPVKRFRDSHHKMARLFASGLRVSEVAELTGYSISRVSVFHNNPAFQALIAEKRGIEDQIARDAISAYNQLILENGLKAERKLADKLDDDDESEELSVRELVSIARDAADRVGLSKRSIQTNISLDFASLLDRAIARSSKVIEDNLPRSGDLNLISSSVTPDRGSPKFKRRF